MKKKFTFLMAACIMLLLTLFIQPGIVRGQNYKKVTSAPSDWSGEYLIVYESSSTAYAWTGVDGASCYATATISNNIIAKPNGAQSVTIAPMTGGYSIKVNGGTNSGKYIKGTSGSNALGFDNNEQLNTISYSSSVDIVSNTSHLRYNSTSGNLRFRYFKSTSYNSQQIIQLYERLYTITISNSIENGSVAATISNTAASSATYGTTITLAATPADGYRLVSFTVTDSDSGNVTVTSTGENTGTFVMPSKNVTISATFEFAPAYTITAQSNNNSYGTVSLSGSTITATPANNYRVSTSTPYSVSPVNSATVSQNGNEFIVTPSANTTVTINFEAIPTYTATFSVNGSTTTQNFAEGSYITFPSDPAAIQGKVFTGWVTIAIAGTTNTAPDFVNTATAIMGDSNITYYAVFATASGTAASLTKMTSSDKFVANDKVVIVASDNVAMYQETYNSTYVNKYTFDNNVATVAADDKNWFTVSAGSSNGTWKLGDGTNGYVYNSSSNNLAISTDNSTDFTLAWNNTESMFTLKAGSSWLSYRSDIATKYFRMGGSGASPNGTGYFDIYKYVAGNLTYSAYCTTVDVYSITAQSNNTTYGTVSLADMVITGSPKSGYRYASPAYSVSPANSATVVQDGNEFTVTPSANTTITINFELIPTYTLSRAVSPANAGTVTLSASSGLVEGATATATASASAGYKFTSWSITGTGAELSSTTTSPTTVTIGTANATVTANFEAVTTYAITYSVNGVTNTVYVEEDAAVNLSAPSSALIPVGYVFKGWRESTLAPTNTDPNDYVTSATSTVNKTYYAVMAAENHNDATWTLDYANENALSSSTSWGEYGTDYDYTASDGGTWTVKAYKNSGMQINIKKDCSIKIPTCSGNIKSIAITCSAAKAVGFSTSDYLGSGSITYVVYGTDATSQTLDFTGKTNTEGYIVPKGGSTSITKIVVTYKVATYSNYCTSVTSVTMTEDVTIAGDLNVTYTLTVPSGKILTVNGTLENDDPANLIIEDGGQLICNNSVAATVQKSIGSWGSKDASGWNFIASPIADPIDPKDAGLITDNLGNTATPATATYDLYYLNMAAGKDHEWQNYRKNTFNLANGKGYLYANVGTPTLNFSGDIQPSNTTVTKSDLYDGYNLVGNPFTCYASLSTDYYTLNSDGSAIVVTEAKSAPIAPCTGVIIESNTVTFTPVTGGELSPGKGNVEMVLAQNVTTRGESNIKTIDNAIISFNEGSQLGKFYFGSQDANLYIPMDNEEYAIVSSSAQGEMPVNFKAHRYGQYTITVNPQEVEMGYLHLIDNIGGRDIDLLATPSYTFNAKADDYESRFRLVFSANMVNTDLNDDFAFFSNGQLVIANEGESLLQVIDVNGRIVMTESVSGTCSKAINVKAGVYVLRLIQGTDVKTQKIIVK